MVHELKPGARLYSSVDPTEFIVVKARAGRLGSNRRVPVENDPERQMSSERSSPTNLRCWPSATSTPTVRSAVVHQGGGRGAGRRRRAARPARRQAATSD